MKTACIITLATLAFGGAVPAAIAHHSFAAFDRDTRVILTGTVREFQWTNPHAWIPVRVTDDEGNVIQRPEQMTILFEVMQAVRRVFLDGREHPGRDDLESTWMGHSIGHWEGDTLVVDTIGVKAGSLNGSGSAIVARDGDTDPRMPYTETLQFTERMRLLDDGQILELEQTIDDPTVYTEPFTLMRYWVRSPETPMLEYICTENLRPEDEG